MLMVDLLADEPPKRSQTPTLTEPEEIRVKAALSQGRTVEWLMVADETPDFEALFESILQRPAWHQRAACRGMGAEGFFPIRGEVMKFRQARVVCEGCEVRSECLGAALDTNERTGVWGGTSDRERRALRRANRVNGFVNVSAQYSTRTGPTRPNDVSTEI